MKKSLIALGLSAVMVAATAVPALADDASLNIYGIYKAGDQTWFIDEGAAAQKAVEAAGGTFTFVDAKMSPEECLKAIDNAIANHADGIVICVPDQTMSQSVVDKCSEAGIEVVAADDALQDADGNKIPGGKYHLDLREANRMTLLRAGVPADHIAVSNVCTMCNVDTFYSYRGHALENEQVAMLVNRFE
jgi:ABC-type sugar transport system substrate-binding protein